MNPLVAACSVLSLAHTDQQLTGGAVEPLNDSGNFALLGVVGTDKQGIALSAQSGTGLQQGAQHRDHLLGTAVLQLIDLQGLGICADTKEQ